MNNTEIKNKVVPKVNDLANYLKKQPSKAKVQELKWKSTINRQSLPTQLLADEIDLNKTLLIPKRSISRRKTESDIDLNLDSYNVNPLEKEINESKKKKYKTKKKCKKTNCNRHGNENCNNDEVNGTIINLIETVETKIIENEPTNEVKKPKNAFSIMMKARHNIIGANLDGKTKSPTSDMPYEEKIEIRNKLSDRKTIFEKWAEKKGSKKRKLQDIAREDYVSNVLDKRAKRLKTLLRNPPKSVSTNDDNSEDSENDKSAKGNKSRKTIKIKLIKKNSKLSSVPKSKHKAKLLDLKVKDENKISNEKENTKNTENKNIENDDINEKIKFSSTNDSSIKSYNIDHQIRSKRTSESDSRSKHNNLDRKIKSKHISENEISNKKDETNKKLKSKHIFENESRRESCDLNKQIKSKCSLENDSSNKTSEIQKKVKSKNNFNSKKTGINKKLKSKLTFENYPSNKNSNTNKKIKSKCIIENDDTNEKSGDTNKEIKSKCISVDDIRDIGNKDQQIEKLNQVLNDTNTAVDSPSRNLRNRTTKFNYSEVQDDFESEKTKSSVPTKNSENKNMKKDFKLAPLFLKSPAFKTIKPKTDPDVVRARQEFLKSGMPDECIKLVEKQKIIDNYECDIFPTISHVFQESNLNYLSSSKEILKKIPFKSYDTKLNDDTIIKRKMTQGLFTYTNTSYNKKPTKWPQKITNIKQVLNELKTQHSEFPIKAVYRSLLNKKQGNEKNLAELPDPTDLMWTEKYKPICSQDIIGNKTSVNELKQWLTTWLTNKENKSKNAKKYDYDSDFESSDSRDSTSSRNNTVVLLGPCGTGKTSSVYAIANELNFNVLEINASSQRTGKRILNEIHEATQSRHFHERFNSGNDLNALLTKTKKEKPNSQNCVQIKMCDENAKYSLILIEDIDIVFPLADEGFLNAVNNIITSGKRPVIITSSDSTSAITQKYMAQNKTLKFNPLSPKYMTPWLQLISIVEDVWSDEHDITKLLNFNNGDMRKTVLHLQFLIENSTGSISDENDPIKSTLSFTNFVETNSQPVPYPVNPMEFYDIITEHLTEANFKNIDMWADIFDNLTLLDIAYTKNKCDFSNDLANSVWKGEFTRFSDSLSVNICEDSYSSMKQTTFDWTYWLNVRQFQTTTDMNKSLEINFQNSSVDKVRLKRKLQTTYNNLLDGISLSAYLGPKNLGIDYFPSLREINRTEETRALLNSKRGNRFCNYLKSLNIHCTDSQLQMLSKSFSTEI